MDGTLGSKTARLLDGSGVQITSREELAEIVRAGARAGWPVAVHAIGDLANRDALDAFEETRDEWSAQGLRPRIEHAQLLAEEDIPRFAKIGVAASVQFSHAPSDRDIAERNWAGMTDARVCVSLAARVRRGGRERLRRADRGARPARRDPRGRPAYARRPRAVAPRAGGHGRAGDRGDDPHARPGSPATSGGAAKLLPGYLADLVVLDRDPLAIGPEELPEVQVVATMLGGRWTHNPPPWD